VPDVAVPPVPKLSVTVTSSLRTMSWGLDESELASVAVTVEVVAPAPSLTGVKLNTTWFGASSLSLRLTVADLTLNPVAVPLTTMVSVPSTMESSVVVMLNSPDVADVLFAETSTEVGNVAV